MIGKVDSRIHLVHGNRGSLEPAVLPNYSWRDSWLGAVLQFGSTCFGLLVSYPVAVLLLKVAHSMQLPTHMLI